MQAKARTFGVARRQTCDSDPERETLEELVEDDCDDERGCGAPRSQSDGTYSQAYRTPLTELGPARDGEGQPDNERVYHDAQLQHLGDHCRQRQTHTHHSKRDTTTHQDADDLSPLADLGLRSLTRVGRALLIDAPIVHVSVPMGMLARVVFPVDAVHPPLHVHVRMAMMVTAAAVGVSVLPVLSGSRRRTTRWRQRCVTVRMRVRRRLRMRV